MGEYKDRYGIPGKEVGNLRCRYTKQNMDEGFRNFDEFLWFCAMQGYEAGMSMRRRDPQKPHSPENTFFKEKQDRSHEKENNWLCADCKRTECTAYGNGCGEYRKRWVENWNKNIHQDIPAKNERKRGTKVFFCYEHPDLEREGIVFESSDCL